MSRTTAEKLRDRLAGEAQASEPSRLEEFYPAVCIDEDGVITEFDPREITEAPAQKGILTNRLSLSVGTMGCNPAECKEQDAQGRTKGRTPLAVIISQVSSTRIVKNPRAGQEKQPDTFLALIGNHEGMNIQESTPLYGMRFRSGVLYLPSDLNDQIGEAFHEIVGPGRKRPGEFRGVQFAMQLFSEPSSNLAGYTYSWRALARTGLPDPLAALRQQAMLLLEAEKRLTEPVQTGLEGALIV